MSQQHPSSSTTDVRLFISRIGRRPNETEWSIAERIGWVRLVEDLENEDDD